MFSLTLQGQFEPNPLIDENIEQSGSFYIRVHIYYYDPAPTGTGWTDILGSSGQEARALAILANLNGAYNPHKIYFVGDGDSCDDQFWSVTTSLNEPNNDFAINILDRGDVNATTFAQGIASGIPSNFFQVFGVHTTPNGEEITAALTTTLIHEMGHSLGLSHTFYGNFNPVDEGGCPDPNSDCNIPNSCCICGDYVCDTEPFSYSAGNINQDCNSMVAPSGGSVDFFTNYMSYIDLIECRDHFSDEQGWRMQTYLMQVEELQKVQGITIHPGPDAPLPLSGGIIVESGVLEINTPIQMLPNSVIRVKPGATLIISSTLTGACNEMWQGIVVEGSIFSPQTSQFQGKVIVNNSGKIEHARVGIDVQDIDENGDPIVATGGGIVKTLGGDFNNNSIGIRFGAYVDNVVQPSPNASKIFFADFSVTDDYRGTEQPTHLDLSGVVSVRILDVICSDQRTECNLLAIGIDAKNASFVASSSNFQDLFIGIRTDELDLGSGSFNAFSNTFERCLTGLYTIGTSSFSLHGNTFTLDRPTMCLPSNASLIGAKLEGKINGFLFKGNTFQYLGSAFPSETLIGTECVNLGEGLGNEINFNTYHNIFWGNRAIGDNGFIGDGLVYLCNENTYDATFPIVGEPSDYIVTIGSTVRREQKFIDNLGEVHPTGNRFSDTDHTFNNLGPIVNYLFFIGDYFQDPDIGANAATGIIAETSNEENENCPDLQPCDFPCNDPQLLVQWKNDFYNNRTDWIANKQLLSTLTNPRDIEETESEITRLRQMMNQDGKRVLLEYSLDTVIIETDSLIHWMGLIETYPLDLQLARHYFFQGDYVTFNQIMGALPTKFSLGTEQQTEVDDLQDVYDVLQPQLSTGVALYNLPETATDQLELLAPYCDEAGYLAQVVLWRNGIVVATDCLTVGSRSFEQTVTVPSNEDSVFRLTPNPSKTTVEITFVNSNEEGIVRIYNNQGQLVDSRRRSLGNSRLPITTTDYPSGIYFVEYISSHNKREFQKLIITH